MPVYASSRMRCGFPFSDGDKYRVSAGRPVPSGLHCPGHALPLEGPASVRHSAAQPRPGSPGCL